MEPPPRPSPQPDPDPAAEDSAAVDPSAVDRPTVDRSEDSPSPDGGKSVRAARLELIREQIAAGVYDTPERLDAALDGLLADLQD